MGLTVVEVRLGGEMMFADEEVGCSGVEAVRLQVEFLRDNLWDSFCRSERRVFLGPLFVGVRAHGTELLARTDDRREKSGKKYNRSVDTLSFRTSVILGLTRSSRYWGVLKVPERSIAADGS